MSRADRDLSKLNPDFKERVELWLAENPEIFVTEAYRTYARQAWLYAQGRTRPWRIVTRTMNSLHRKGIAVDIAFRGWELYPRDHSKRRKVSDSAKKYGIDRGYDLWKTDKPHYQLNPNAKPLQQQLPPEKIAFLRSKRKVLWEIFDAIEDWELRTHLANCWKRMNELGATRI